MGAKNEKSKNYCSSGNRTECRSPDGLQPRNAMSTLSTESDSETAEVFSLTKVLDLGTNYLVSLDYENAILQYIDIIQHDPKTKKHTQDFMQPMPHRERQMRQAKSLTRHRKFLRMTQSSCRNF